MDVVRDAHGTLRASMDAIPDIASIVVVAWSQKYHFGGLVQFLYCADCGTAGKDDLRQPAAIHWI